MRIISTAVAFGVMILISSSLLYAEGPGKNVQNLAILRVEVDAATMTLTAFGQGFLGPNGRHRPAMFLGGSPLTLTGEISQTRIEAQLPDGLAAGAYRLVVAVFAGGRAPRLDSMDLIIGNDSKVDPTQPLVRKIARAHGVGPMELADVGPLNSRILVFEKKNPDTGIRVSYVDNLRTFGVAASCRWEIYFNGLPCSNPGPLVFDQYSGHNGGPLDNDHRSSTNFGTCFGLTEGTHVIQVRVGPTPGEVQGDCFTGWKNQYWALEAEEVY